MNAENLDSPSDGTVTTSDLPPARAKSDRELLELAAKAAGLRIDKSPHNGGGSGNTGFDAAGNAVLDWHNGKTWNPLVNDGDALRLAVKLNLTTKYDTEPDGSQVLVGAPWHEEFPLYWWIEWLGKDAAAATRRAIVRAAAEIGREADPSIRPFHRPDPNTESTQ